MILGRSCLPQTRGSARPGRIQPDRSGDGCVPTQPSHGPIQALGLSPTFRKSWVPLLDSVRIEAYEEKKGISLIA